MPINRARVVKILTVEKDNLAVIAASVRGWIGYTVRRLNTELRLIGREDLIGFEALVPVALAEGTARTLAEQAAVLRGQYARIASLAKYDVPLHRDNLTLVLASIDLKGYDIVLLDAARTSLAFNDSLSATLSAMVEITRADMAELAEMLRIPIPPQLFRIHVSHLWYANYQVGSTPTPFLMASTFVYTTRPDKWRFGTLNDALVALETEQLSLRFAMKGKFRHRDEKRDNRVRGILDVMRREGREPTGAARIGKITRVIGVEAEKIDWDEIFGGPVAGRVVGKDTIKYYDEDTNEIFPILEITEDTILYYLLFYKVFGSTPQSAGSYFGRVIQLPVGFRFEIISYTETPWMDKELVSELDNGMSSFDRSVARWRR